MLGFFAFGGDDERQAAPVELDACRGLLAEAARDCFVRSFGARVAGEDDPRPAVAAIEQAARREGGFALEGCHGVMHTVGRVYALEEKVTLERLRDYLPRSNDPGCSAGFAHGVVTAVGPRGPAEAAAACAESGTRYRRYSCIHGVGHAFMRRLGDRLEPALELCRGLGEDAPDCAQGAFHDYWFAVVGEDGAALSGAAERDPRRLCGAQAPEFVRPCWYRAFVDDPPPVDVDSPEHLEVLCAGLAGLQRAGCVTAAAVIGPANPADQLEICAALASDADAEACVRGTKVQNLLGRPLPDFVRLVEGCERLAVAAACYRWLGKVTAVVTDGAFARDGCPALSRPSARRECTAGARTSGEALVTFS